MPSVGWQELIIVLVIMLVIFGPKRLPEIGRSLGKGIKEFKKSTSEIQEQLTQEEPQVAKTEAAESQPVAAPEAKEAPEARTAPEATTSEPKAS
ncbi:MAG: Sec-independent protein translocase subunit TatA/TatB [Thermoleophilia bacterium]